ncbi:MAG: signal peptidase I [Sphingomonas sp.]|nr:signal peptidase I [Sphingomonas sp.]
MARARKSEKSERGGLIRFILIVALLAWAVRSLVVAPFSIPSGSMLPTLFIGDYVAAAKWPYGYSRYSFPFQFPPIEGRIPSNLPERGDVVVFASPSGQGDDLVKRVIGLPGDTVEVANGRLILNGRPVPRGDMKPLAIPISPNSPCRVVGGATAMVSGSGEDRACVYPTYLETLPGGASYTVIDQVEGGVADTMAATKVPAGRLFLMGDNRDDSLDSRYLAAEGGIGMVPIDHVIGRAAILFWSTDGSASYVRPWTWFSALRGGRIGNTFASEGQ